MHDEIIGPFVQGTLEMMGSMLGLDGQVCDFDQAIHPAPHLFGTIPLGGRAQGRITVGLLEADGRELVGAMMGLDGADVDDELMLDGLGEIANVIAGFATSALSDNELKLEIGLPEVAKQAPVASAQVVQRRIESELGAFHLSLELVKML